MVVIPIFSGDAQDGSNASRRGLQIVFNRDVLGNVLGLGAEGDGPYCGDTIVQTGEECDDGNRIDNDACRNTCMLPRCGDRLLSEGEECEDGNSLAGDGCNRLCQREVETQVRSETVDMTIDPVTGEPVASVLPNRTVEGVVREVATSRAPAGQTGPAAVGVMAAGAAAGWAWVRRRRQLQMSS